MIQGWFCRKQRRSHIALSEALNTQRGSFEFSAIAHTVSALLFADIVLCVCMPSLCWSKLCVSSWSVFYSQEFRSFLLLLHLYLPMSTKFLFWAGEYS